MDLTSPPVRVSYPNVFKARSVMGGAPTFSITMMFDKKNKEHLAALKKVKAMAEKALTEKWPDVNKRPRIPVFGHDKSVIKDGDKNCDSQGIPLSEKNPEYAGHYIVKASARESYPPVVVDRAMQEILSDSKIYGGCFCKVSFNCYAFSHKLNKGITCGLNGVQFWEDGESFGKARPKADEMFDADEEYVDDDPLGTDGDDNPLDIDDDDIPF